MNLWKRLGLQIHLPQDTKEKKFVNSLAIFSSSWLRIKFVNDEVYTNDPFQGKAGFLFFMCLDTLHINNFESSKFLSHIVEDTINSQINPPGAITQILNKVS